MRLCNLRGGSGLTEMHGWCSRKERVVTHISGWAFGLSLICSSPDT
jgi:hypothetical protein